MPKTQIETENFTACWNSGDGQSYLVMGVGATRKEALEDGKRVAMKQCPVCLIQGTWTTHHISDE